MKKSKGIAILIAVLLVLSGLAYYASLILSSTGKGAGQNIKLGLDLAGGVSITYKVETKNPTKEEMSDTIYKLQKRVEQYSTEAAVYQQGDDRITVEIPGVSDANKILEDLGTPGSLEFQDPNGVVKLTGDDVKDAQAATTQDNMGNKQYVVELTFNDAGTKKFAELTTANVGKRCPIVYDGQTISDPNVQEAITGGKAEISGQSTFEEADQLAANIRIGSLKLKLKELQSQVVGAQLGAEAISTALKAASVGLAALAIFMIAYYWVAGIAAIIALALYSTAVVAIIYLFDITLTLPGIAGIILSIGMAVDANVLIFSRIREEIAQGKSVYTALQTGFKRALPAIIDGNLTTLIAAAVLAIRGSGTVKGFAYTLAIGIILSMFTALFVTDWILRALYMVGFRDVKFYGKHKDRKPLPFLKRKYIFFTISGIVILAGLVSMGVNTSKGKGAFNYSLEFVGGTSTTVPFDKNYTLKQIDEDIVPYVKDITGNSDIQTQKVKDSNQIVFKTRNLSLKEREALNKTFVDHFKVDVKKISSQNISSTISKEMTMDAIWAVIISNFFILLYIWFRFKDVRFALAAILALVHDVLVVLTCYAVLRLSVGSTFIAVVLTIVGYSINDTIVVFDRIRENLRATRNPSIEQVKELADHSITQTLVRSINTSMTVFIMVFLLWLFGVAALKDFALPLMVGVASGTYSSICNATPIWYLLKKFSMRQDKKKAITSHATKSKKRK